MNETIQSILTRRSCKSYQTDKMVPKEIIDQIVIAGLYAANGMGRQAADIIVVTDKETRDKLSQLNAKYDLQKRPDPFYGAPVVLCVVVPKEDYTGIEDGSLVIGNMLLAAHSLGIGSCWIHRAKQVFEDPEGIGILKKIGFDDSYMGVGNCVLGYPKRESGKAAPRREGRVFEI